MSIVEILMLSNLSGTFLYYLATYVFIYFTRVCCFWESARLVTLAVVELNLFKVFAIFYLNGYASLYTPVGQSDGWPLRKKQELIKYLLRINVSRQTHSVTLCDALCVA